MGVACFNDRPSTGTTGECPALTLHAAHSLRSQHGSAHGSVHGSVPGHGVLMPVRLGMDRDARRQHGVRLAGPQRHGQRGLLGADADERRRLRQAEAVQRQAL